MKYTYFCVPGKLLRPGLHYIFIGEWIRPAGCLILQHGNFTYQEVLQIERQGFVRIFEDDTENRTFPEEYHIRADVRKYRANNHFVAGVLRRKEYNLFVGHIVVGRIKK